MPALFPSLLPMDPTRVRRDARILAVEHLHLPHEAAGVDKTPLKRALVMAVAFIL